MQRRFIVTGDLVADYYYHGNELVLIDGGSSKFNALVNLSFLGNSTSAISACSNSKIGDMLLHSLNIQNVNTSDILRIDTLSRIYHLTSQGDGSFKSSKICPICGQKTWYRDSFANLEYCLPRIQKSDIILFDNLRDEDIDMITSSENEKLIDIGHISSLYNRSNKLIASTLCSRFQIMQLNEKVAIELKTRFSLESDMDLYLFFKPKVLIITKGKKGAEIISNSHIYNKVLKNPYAKEIDTTGAGDAFFATFINEYYASKKKVTRSFIDSTFNLATSTTSLVVLSSGARGHIHSGLIPEKDPNKCTCQDLLNYI